LNVGVFWELGARRITIGEVGPSRSVTSDWVHRLQREASLEIMPRGNSHVDVCACVRQPLIVVVHVRIASELADYFIDIDNRQSRIAAGVRPDPLTAQRPNPLLLNGKSTKGFF
jgi:hypothetical protein